MISWTSCSFNLGTNADKLQSGKIQRDRVPFDAHILNFPIFVLQRGQDCINQFADRIIEERLTQWVLKLIYQIAGSHETKVGVYTTC